MELEMVVVVVVVLVLAFLVAIKTLVWSILKPFYSIRKEEVFLRRIELSIQLGSVEDKVHAKTQLEKLNKLRKLQAGIGRTTIYAEDDIKAIEVLKRELEF